jgi:hypothetical protein
VLSLQSNCNSFSREEAARARVQQWWQCLGSPACRHPAALPTRLTKLSLWAPYSPHAQRPHPVLGPALRHLTRLRCLWLGGWRLSHADLPPSLQLLKLQVLHPADHQLSVSYVAL